MPMRRVLATLGPAALVWAALVWAAPGPGALAAPAGPVVMSQIEGDIISVIAVRIMKEAYRRLGIAATAAVLPNERGIQDSNDGVTDAETIRKAGIERSYLNLVPVPEPVLTFETRAFTTGLSFKVAGWDSLRPYTVCLLRGMKVAEEGTEGMRRVIGNTPEQVVLMLAAGRCEVAVLGRGVWTEIDRLKAGPMRELEPPVAVIPLFHYVNRRHADLAPKLAEMLRELRRDGTIDRAFAAEMPGVEAARQRNSLPPER